MVRSRKAEKAEMPVAGSERYDSVGENLAAGDIRLVVEDVATEVNGWPQRMH